MWEYLIFITQGLEVGSIPNFEKLEARSGSTLKAQARKIWARSTSILEQVAQVPLPLGLATD